MPISGSHSGSWVILLANVNVNLKGHSRFFHSEKLKVGVDFWTLKGGEVDLSKQGSTSTASNI